MNKSILMKLNKYKGLWKSKTNQNVNIKKTIRTKVFENKQSITTSFYSNWSFPKVIFAVYELKHHNSLRPYNKKKQQQKQTQYIEQKSRNVLFLIKNNRQSWDPFFQFWFHIKLYYFWDLKELYHIYPMVASFGRALQLSEDCTW